MVRQKKASYFLKKKKKKTFACSFRLWVKPAARVMPLAGWRFLILLSEITAFLTGTAH
jgi:hypothetical protein